MKEERKKYIKNEEGRNERIRKEVREQEKQGNRHNMKQGRKAINKHKKMHFRNKFGCNFIFFHLAS
jgi:hypothetical protein